MCDQRIGVTRAIDVRQVSADLADFIKQLEHDVHAEHVDVPVEKVKKLTESLEKIIAPKT